MAKSKRGGGAMYVFLSILALNFLVLLIFVASQYKLGKVSKADLVNIAYVLLGRKTYSMTEEEVMEYRSLLALREERHRIDALELGGLETQELSAEGLAEQIRLLREQHRIARDEQQQQLAGMERTRREIESLKTEAQKERERLNAVRRQRQQADLSERQQYLRDLLQAMDAEQIAAYLVNISEGRGGPSEAARILRAHLPPAMSAEVTEAMPLAVLRQILPLIENQYADMEPDAVVKLWTTRGTDDYKTPPEIAEYLNHMTVKQAFEIFSLLDPQTRNEVERLLQ